MGRDILSETTFPHTLLSRLLDALDALDHACALPRAGTASDGGRAEKRARSKAIDAVMHLSSSLDPINQPEICAHLQAVCDACLTRLGGLNDERSKALRAAIALVTPIRDAMRSAS